MEFYNRVKQKLADELEPDGPLEFPEGNGNNDVESLKQEIEELKHHLNTNYTVYVKRIEKHKSKRKDLEACLREVTTENERLSREADQAETYRQKLELYREQLEQLESYQSQELAKVKHMLLNAEAALESEKQKNQLNQHETLDISNSNGDDNDNLSKLKRDNQELHLKLLNAETALESEKQKNGLNQQDESLDITNGQDHDEELAKLKQDNQELHLKLVDVMNERDAMKANLLEIEIANHECDQAKFNEIAAFKVEIAKLQAEIETLNVTLNVRDSDIKAKKEELKRQKESHTSTIETIEANHIKVSTMEAEIESLKCTLSDRLMQLREAQKLGDQLQEKVEGLQGTITTKEKLLSEITTNEENLTKQCNVLSDEKSRLQGVIDGLNIECDQQRDHLTNLTESNKNHVEALKSLTDDNNILREEFIQLEASIPNIVENSDLVKSLREKENQLEQDCEEKKQAVRHLQLRTNEMKKMLQKEMKSGNSGGGDATVINQTINGNSGQESPTFPNEEVSSSNGSDSAITSSVTLAYMRHVIFKFLTSPEVESKQMTRALATILQFTKEEEKKLQDHLDWKMSWFGPKPKLLH